MSPKRFPDSWHDADNGIGDNLAGNQDDEPEDDEEGFNWVNNPIRRLFDNPIDSSHRSFLDRDDDDDCDD